jgi:tetratricopeptide (TPR) repeat protein
MKEGGSEMKLFGRVGISVLRRVLHGATSFVLSNLFCAVTFAAPPPESPIVAEARELVDTYYGSQSNLTQAAELLARAYEINPNDSRVFVEAARITVMGGHLAFDRFQAGTFERYEALLDKAISLDSSNAKAYLLKAEVFEHEGRYNQELAALEKSKALNPDDPWLSYRYGSYYRKTRATGKSYSSFAELERRGPGATASDRKAYVSAMVNLAGFQIGDEKVEDNLRKYAALAVAARYPADAWTPHSFAERFIDVQLFDEAILYAREALKTMNFGAGRLTLAAALYGKSAKMVTDGSMMKEVRQYVNEAATFGFPKSAILDYLLNERGMAGSLNTLQPALNSVLRLE